MLRFIAAGLLCVSHFTSLFSLEKSCIFESSAKGSLVIDSTGSGQEVIVQSYSLENTSDKAIRGIFLSINAERECQKAYLRQQLLDKNNLWKWWKHYHPTAEENGAYSSLAGSTLHLPTRDVPMHGVNLKEFFFDEKWHLIDNRQNLVYIALDNHSIAGYEDIADEPFLALRTKTTNIEEPYNFAKACSNFARLNIFPQTFDCFEPSGEDLQLHWHDYQFDLYPHENILFESDGAIVQTLMLAERALQSDMLHISTGFPIVRIVNQSPDAITLEDQNFLLEPNEAYDFDQASFSIHLSITNNTGQIALISKVNEMPKWKLGTNDIHLGIEKNPGTAQLKLHYNLQPISLPEQTINIANANHHFDHITPYFELENKESLPEKIWWQISIDKDFDFVIPNFERIQDFKQNIQLDSCTDTFFNPHEAYYFRLRELHDGQWSHWSPVFEFTVSKPEQVKPAFKKLGDNQYQISWEPASEPDTQYLVFASNAYDFMPSIYASEQYSLIDQNHELSEQVNNLIATTAECSLNIGTEYAFYRVIAERHGQYSIPSPLVRVYDYGLSIPRSVLQTAFTSPELCSAERVAFPPAYPHFPEQNYLGGKCRAFDTAHLLKGRYVQSPYVETIVWNYVQPFFLPENHPVKPKLDRLFSKRVTQSSSTLKKAGFTQPDPMKFSKTIVSPNKNVPGYMFKFFCDDQKGISDWQRLFYRVTGAIYIQDALNRYNINHLFVVPSKWIYPLPAEPSPPANMERKNFIVVEDKLDIYTGSENNKMWKSPIINPVTLTWIVFLLQELGLSDSPYNFNMPITKDNRISFIDTEHHHKWPVPLYKLWSYLSSDMGSFWNELCRQVGQ